MPDEKTIAEDTIRSMPDPSPIADEKQQAEQTTGQSQQSSPVIEPIRTGPIIRDSLGGIFDPSIHVDPSKRNNDGSFRKKRGRKPGSSLADIPKNTREASIAAGKATAETIFLVCTLTMGPDWKPLVDTAKGIDERSIVADAWGNYYAAVGITTIPPWLELSVVMASYALPRLTTDESKSRLGKFTVWIMGQFSSVKKKVVGKES